MREFFEEIKYQAVSKMVIFLLPRSAALHHDIIKIGCGLKKASPTIPPLDAKT
jgi:hypothetical protein